MSSSIHTHTHVHTHTHANHPPMYVCTGGSQLLSKSDRIVIIGAGPTGLGAGYRLSEQLLNKKLSNEVIILESEQKAGGLASSYRDQRGFLWDNGGHVVFSHYPYFDKLLKKAVQDWNVRSRASFAFMQGSSGERSSFLIQCKITFMFWTRKNKTFV